MNPGAADWLIAHRGWPARYPENSLEGIRAVITAGARHVEFDVQITADGQPIVIHDDDLQRLSGKSGRVTRSRLDELGSRRLRDGARIPTLDEALATLDEYPETTAFVELKRHSIERFGRRRAVEAICSRLRRASGRCVFLSFDRRAVARARAACAGPTGWVVRRWSLDSRLRAALLTPDYLFVRADRVPDGPRPFWPGSWCWAVYGVSDLDAARRWRERGADLVEVDDLPGLLDQAHDRR